MKKIIGIFALSLASISSSAWAVDMDKCVNVTFSKYGYVSGAAAEACGIDKLTEAQGKVLADRFVPGGYRAVKECFDEAQKTQTGSMRALFRIGAAAQQAKQEISSYQADLCNKLLY